MVAAMPIIKDSSIWDNNFDFSVIQKKDMGIRVGIVREARIDTATDDISYIVEVFDTNNQIPVYCKRMERFGGVYNYEEFTHRGYTADKSSATGGEYSVRAGDVVIVAYINGDSREGIILGSIKHPGRTRQTAMPSDIAYKNEFNGVETLINTSGELKVTFRGVPTNTKDLLTPPNGRDIPPPTYDTDIGSSYYQLDKVGSWITTDNAKQNPQSIKIDKPNGKITIISGKVSITIDKNAQSIKVITKDTTIESSNSIKESTKDYSIDAKTTYKLRSPKIAIGHSGTELLDQITKLVDAIGKLTIISPLGPCSAIITAPQWSGVDKVKKAINEIKGSL